MNNVVFAFDLHNTLLRSNNAWVEAYMELSEGRFREEVGAAIYRKQSRKKIAEDIGVSYDEVYNNYCRLVKPIQDMVKLLESLKKHFPIYLISAASALRVENDLASWDGQFFFDMIITKENFCKEHAEDWKQLMAQQNIDLLIYIGNDIEEDIPILPGVIPLIYGDFLKTLDNLDLLMRRGEASE